MGLSRKHKRELKRLRRSAEHVWDEQRETLEHATKVLRDAQRHAARYARDEVQPRLRTGYEKRVRPAIQSGVATGRSAVRSARGRLADDVIPAVSGGIGSALAALEAAKDPRVRDIVKRASAANKDYSKKARKAVAPPKKSAGPGTYILIGLGVAAVASIAYAAWQTLRADDDLWIEDAGPAEADLDSAN